MAGTSEPIRASKPEPRRARAAAGARQSTSKAEQTAVVTTGTAPSVTGRNALIANADGSDTASSAACNSALAGARTSSSLCLAGVEVGAKAKLRQRRGTSSASSIGSVGSGSTGSFDPVGRLMSSNSVASGTDGRPTLAVCASERARIARHRIAANCARSAGGKCAASWVDGMGRSTVASVEARNNVSTSPNSTALAPAQPLPSSSATATAALRSSSDAMASASARIAPIAPGSSAARKGIVWLGHSRAHNPGGARRMHRAVESQNQPSGRRSKCSTASPPIVSPSDTT
eukprot:scaffold206489_cov28-Tisochrysis_lutea.AAC.2